MPDKETQENPDWTSRLDRLLSTSPTAQIGQTVEALQAQIASLSDRIEKLAGGPVGSGEIADAASLLAELETRLSEVDGVARNSVVRIGGIDDALQQTVARVAALGEQLDAVSRRAKMDADVVAIAERVEEIVDAKVAELRAVVEEQLAALSATSGTGLTDVLASRLGEQTETFDKKLELLGRQIGAPLGRLRAQLDEIVERVGNAPDVGQMVEQSQQGLREGLETRVAALEQSIDARGIEMRSALEERVGALDARVVTFARELADAVGMLSKAADDKLTTLAAQSSEHLATSLAEVRSGVSAIEERLTQALASVRSSVEERATASVEAVRTSVESGVAAALDAMRASVEARLATSAEATRAAIESSTEAVRVSLDSLEHRIGDPGEALRAAVASAEEHTAALLQTTAAGLEASEQRNAERMQALENVLERRAASIIEASRSALETAEKRAAAITESSRSAMIEAERRVEVMMEGSRAALLEAEQRTAERIGAVETAIREMPDLSQAIAQQADASDRRFETLAQQHATLSARVKAALETMSGQVTTIAQRVDAVPDLREELGATRSAVEGAVGATTEKIAEEVKRATETFAQTWESERAAAADEAAERARQASDALATGLEPVGALREGLASTVDLLNAIGERLASLEKASNLSGRAVKAQADALAGAVTDAVKAQVASMMEHVAALDRRLVGLASAEQVAAALQSDRDMMEQGFTQHSETLQTLSGSAGAIYVRVRAMEHAMEDMRKATLEETDRYESILKAIEDVARIEERLSERIGVLESRVAGADRERDREFLALLAELAEMVGRGDRSKFAERLRVFERKQEGEH